MDQIIYNGYKYKKLYAHANGGTYYVSQESDVVDSWLDVYPNGDVFYLWNGRLSRMGCLKNGIVIK